MFDKRYRIYKNSQRELQTIIKVGADIRIRVRRGIVRIEIERSSIQTVVPITTEIGHFRSITIRIIRLNILSHN